MTTPASLLANQEPVYLDRTGRLLGVAVAAIAVVISATIILVDGVRSFGELVTVLLLGVSLAIAAVPEGLTAITTLGFPGGSSGVQSQRW